MEYLLTFPNTHQVMKAESLLNGKGIKTKPMPLPTALGASCGITLRIDEQKVTEGEKILAENKVALSAIYQIHQEDGKKEYWPWKV